MGGRGSPAGTGKGGIQSKLNAQNLYRQSMQRVDKARQDARGISLDQFRNKINELREQTSGGTQAMYDFLQNFIRSKGWRLKEVDQVAGHPNAHGLAQYGKGTIQIKKDLTISQKVKTTAHEIYHMNTHNRRASRNRPRFSNNPQKRRGQEEMEAEMFADMVSKKLGVKSPSSPYYIEGWRTRTGIPSNYPRAAKPDLTTLYNEIFPD